MRSPNQLDQADLSLTPFNLNIRGVQLSILDQASSQTPCMVEADFNEDPMGLDSVMGPIQTIVDIGANTGIFSLYARRRFPDAIIHAFEPYPQNFDVLVKNVASERIFPHRHAVAGRECKMPLSAPSHNSGAACFAQGIFRESDTVDCIPLDAILDITGPIDFLKIDIEGMEYETLLMFTRWKEVKHLAVEIHGLFPYPKLIWEKGVRDFVDWLKKQPFTGELWINDLEKM